MSNLLRACPNARRGNAPHFIAILVHDHEAHLHSSSTLRNQKPEKPNCHQKNYAPAMFRRSVGPVPRFTQRAFTHPLRTMECATGRGKPIQRTAGSGQLVSGFWFLVSIFCYQLAPMSQVHIMSHRHITRGPLCCPTYSS